MKQQVNWQLSRVCPDSLSAVAEIKHKQWTFLTTTVMHMIVWLISFCEGAKKKKIVLNVFRQLIACLLQLTV